MLSTLIFYQNVKQGIKGSHPTFSNEKGRLITSDTLQCHRQKILLHDLVLSCRKLSDIPPQHNALAYNPLGRSETGNKLTFVVVYLPFKKSASSLANQLMTAPASSGVSLAKGAKKSFIISVMTIPGWIATTLSCGFWAAA